MSSAPNITTIDQTWTTESGFDFSSLDIAWNSWGTLNETKDNVILIFHALTGHSNAEEWFSGLFSEQGIIDLDKHFVLCINNLGSCYGSTGPTSINPVSGKAYQADFPVITIRDIVRFQISLLDFLGIQGVELTIGGSMGGMIALEFALMDKRIRSFAILAMGKSHSPWAIGISHAQRQAIFADEHWNNGYYSSEFPPSKGLAAARAMAMITYRSAQNYETKFGRSYNSTKNSYEVESYLKYQGEKLANRFDANSYVRLTQAMDTHDISRDRGIFKETLAQLEIPGLVIGVDSDLLYPVHEQRELAHLIPNSVYKEINSPHGHDAFLIEFNQINRHLSSFLKTFSKS
ncbi:MAG: homoserine O-acetyltransferase [Balneola sp.]